MIFVRAVLLDKQKHDAEDIISAIGSDFTTETSRTVLISNPIKRLKAVLFFHKDVTCSRRQLKSIKVDGPSKPKAYF